MGFVRIGNIGLLIPGFITFVVYLLTLAPGVVGLDSAELATGAYTLGIVHPTGYPLYLLLGRAFQLVPIGSMAFRLNLMSAVFGALTIVLLGILVRRMTGAVWAAWVVGLGLGLGPSFWRMSLVAEVYTLHTFFLATILLVLHVALTTSDRRWLLLGSLLFGLSLANHVSGILYGPFLAWAALRIRPSTGTMRHVASLAGLFFIGLTPYLYLPIRYASHPALDYARDFYNVDLGTLSGIWWMVSGQAYSFFSFRYDWASYVGELGHFASVLWLNFTGLGILLGLAGMVRAFLRRDKYQLGAAWIFAAFATFFSGYAVADKETMFLPAHAIWCIWIALGAHEIFERMRVLGRRLPSTRHLSSLLQGIVLLAVSLSGAFRWRQMDLSTFREPELFGLQVLNSSPPYAMVIGSWSSAVVLEYLQDVEGIRPDVEVFNRSRFEVAQYYAYWSRGATHQQAVSAISHDEQSLIENALGQGRTILSIEFIPVLAGRYTFRPSGTAFQVLPRHNLHGHPSSDVVPESVDGGGTEDAKREL